MPSLLEVCHRAQTGPRVEAESFDLDYVYATAKKLCAKYGIVCDPANPVPADDDLADRIYQAGLDFFCEVGVYCSDTCRLIHFSRDEVLEVVENSQRQCVMGEGKDRFVFSARKPDSDGRPWLHVGTGIMNTDERIAFNLVRAYGELESARSISIPALGTVGGYSVAAGTPSEIYGSIRSIQIARDALRQAGRPGIAIANCLSSAGTGLGTIAASAPQFGLRPSDGWLLGAYAEMKVKIDTLNKAAYLLNWGANHAGVYGAFVGGYAGGPATTAVLCVAYIFMGLLVYHCNYHILFPMFINNSCSTMREVLWTIAVSAQALSRNTREPILCLGYAAAGPMTRQFFYESAAHITTAIASGLSPQTTHPAGAVFDDYITPMEMRAGVEIAEACTGMKRAEVNAIVNELLKNYEDTIRQSPQGSKYQECYDIKNGNPCQQYVDLYGEVKDELRRLGIPMR